MNDWSNGVEQGAIMCLQLFTELGRPSEVCAVLCCQVNLLSFSNVFLCFVISFDFQDVLDVLQEKLQISLWQHFALTVQDTATGRISLLQPHETLAQVRHK